MDQIFDRLERLFKSWVVPDAEEGRASPGGARRSGDPDLDAAMDELDDYLDKDRAAAEQRQKARLEAEARARSAAGAGSRQGGASPGAGARNAGPNPRLVAAYGTLGLPYGAPFAQVKAAYKKLLMLHHPDRHHASPGDLKKATELSAKINAAYQLIEVWSSTGRLPEA